MVQARTTYELTEIFHEAFGHPVSEGPTIPGPKTAALRIALILEELEELAAASFPGLTARGVAEALHGGDGDLLAKRYEPDLVEIADAYADLDVVVNGGALVHGLPMAELAEEVFASNMSKLGADGKPIYREDGKIAKGPGFREPDIEAVLLGRE